MGGRDGGELGEGGGREEEGRGEKGFGPRAAKALNLGRGWKVPNPCDWIALANRESRQDPGSTLRTPRVITWVMLELVGRGSRAGVERGGGVSFAARHTSEAACPGKGWGTFTPLWGRGMAQRL